MMSLPWASSARALASTSKADSVPIRDMRSASFICGVRKWSQIVRPNTTPGRQLRRLLSISSAAGHPPGPRLTSGTMGVPTTTEESEMLIGVPKESKVLEFRVGLTPDSVREFVAHGHKAVVETHAGAGIGCSDDDYRAAGAEIAGDAKEVFARAEMIVK